MKIITKFKVKLILFALAISALVTKIAIAASPNAIDRLRRTAETVGYSTENVTPQSIIMYIVIAALGFVALIFLITIIYSGFQWMTAGGNEEKITEAKRRLKYAVIGLVIIIAAYTITIYISSIITKATTEGYYNFP